MSMAFAAAAGPGWRSITASPSVRAAAASRKTCGCSVARTITSRPSRSTGASTCSERQRAARRGARMPRPERKSGHLVALRRRFAPSLAAPPVAVTCSIARRRHHLSPAFLAAPLGVTKLRSSSVPLVAGTRAHRPHSWRHRSSPSPRRSEPRHRSLSSPRSRRSSPAHGHIARIPGGTARRRHPGGRSPDTAHRRHPAVAARRRHSARAGRSQEELPGVARRNESSHSEPCPPPTPFLVPPALRWAAAVSRSRSFRGPLQVPFARG